MKFYLPPPNQVLDFKKSQFLKFSYLFFFLTPLLLKAQSPEPEIFDWSESYIQTTKTEFIYNPNILDQLSDDAMFYVTIKPREEKREVLQINKNEINIYERYKILYYKINGDDFNYGLAEMVNSNGSSHFALMSNPNQFHENENPELIHFNYKTGTLENSSFNPQELRVNLEESGMPTYVEDNTLWYRNTDTNTDISFPDDETISTIDLNTGERRIERYAEIQNGVYRVINSQYFVPNVSVEGFCYERKLTTTYENFEIVNNIAAPRSIKEKSPIDLDIIQNGEGIIKFINSDFEIEGATVEIFDLLGRPLTNGIISNQSFPFKPNVSGIYIVSIKKGSNQISKKLYLN